MVWGDPETYSTYFVPLLSKHFVLFVQLASYTLLSNDEIHERYLVAEYFNNPDADFLKKYFYQFVGRQDAYHNAKTLERGIKICRIFHFYDRTHDCGAVPTSLSLLGDPFFVGLEKKFKDDVKPNIKDYLKKYHVSYILKDDVKNPTMHPEDLGAVRVYSDGRFELFKLPN